MKFNDLKKISTDHTKVWAGMGIVLAIYGAAQFAVHSTGQVPLVIALGLLGAAYIHKSRPAKITPEKYKLFD